MTASPTFGIILAAAGSGSRYGGPVTKTFLPLGGIPVWRRSLDAVLNGCVSFPIATDHTVVVAAADDRDRFDSVRTVSGGATRAQSVLNGLRELVVSSRPPTHVIVHDAARPLVTPSEVDAVCRSAAASGAAILATPVNSTIKRIREGRVVETVPRDDLAAAQTPQVARLDWLLEAFEHIGADPSTVITDEATALQLAGRPVKAVPGLATNLKITRPDDLVIAEAILASREWAATPSSQ